MEPIISPWLIWLSSVSGDVKTVFGAVGVLSGLGVIVTLMFGAILSAEDYDEGSRFFLAAAKKLACVCVPFCVIAIVTPGRNTAIAMLVAQNVTHERVEAVVEMGGDVREIIKKDIVDILNAVQGEGAK